MTGVQTCALPILDGIGDLPIDDVAVVSGDTAGVGVNLIRNGDMETSSSSNSVPQWLVAGNSPATSSLTTQFSHSGSNSLRLAFGSAGSPNGNLYQDLPSAVTNGTSTLSFWYLPSFTASNLTVRIGTGSSGGFRTNLAVRANLATPGRPNSIARSLPTMPPVWLNEVQGSNVHGITDGVGEHGSWVELYNSGAGSVDLSGLDRKSVV